MSVAQLCNKRAYAPEELFGPLDIAGGDGFALGRVIAFALILMGLFDGLIQELQGRTFNDVEMPGLLV